METAEGVADYGQGQDPGVLSIPSHRRTGVSSFPSYFEKGKQTQVPQVLGEIPGCPDSENCPQPYLPSSSSLDPTLPPNYCVNLATTPWSLSVLNSKMEVGLLHLSYLLRLL